jgi:hypothetical protein
MALFNRIIPWLVPPVVVPIFLILLIIARGLTQ